MLSWTLKTIWFALSLSGTSRTLYSNRISQLRHAPLTGLLACWLVLLSFAKSVGRYWLFLGYCIGCTLLQGIFCIGWHSFRQLSRYTSHYLAGMVWRMNPFDMPQAFCIGTRFAPSSSALTHDSIAAQPIIIGFASVLLSGICTTFAFSTRDMLSSQDPRYAQG